MADDSGLINLDPSDISTDLPVPGVQYSDDQTVVNMQGDVPASLKAAMQNVPAWRAQGLSDDEITARVQKASRDTYIERAHQAALPQGAFTLDPKDISVDLGTAKSSFAPDWQGPPQKIPDLSNYAPPKQNDFGLTDWTPQVPYSPVADPSLLDTNYNALKQTQLGAQLKQVEDQLGKMTSPQDYNDYLHASTRGGGPGGFTFGNATPYISEEQFAKMKGDLETERDQLEDSLRRTYETQQQQQAGMRNRDEWVKEGLAGIAPVAAGIGLGVVAPEVAPITAPMFFGTQSAAQKYGEMRGAGFDDKTATKGAALTGGINAAAAVLPGGAIAARLESPFARWAALSAANELSGVAATPAQMYADASVTGQPVFDADVWDATKQAAKSNLLPSVALGSLGALHGPDAAEIQARTANEGRRLLNEVERSYVKEGADLANELAGGEPPGGEHASTVLGHEEGNDEAVAGEGAVGGVGETPRGAGGGSDVQQNAQTGRGAGNEEQQDLVDRLNSLLADVRDTRSKLGLPDLTEQRVERGQRQAGAMSIEDVADAVKRDDIERAYAQREDDEGAARDRQLAQAAPDMQEARLQDELSRAQAAGMNEPAPVTAMELALRRARGEDTSNLYARDEPPLKLGGGDQTGSQNFIDELHDQTTENPMSPRERIHTDENGQSIGATMTTPRLSNKPNQVHLSSIRALGEKGKGNGNAVMKMLTALADKHGVTLDLIASQFGDDGGPTSALLKDWYGRHGFEPSGRSGQMMVRAPKPAENLYARREPSGAQSTEPKMRTLADWTQALKDHFGATGARKFGQLFTPIARKNIDELTPELSPAQRDGVKAFVHPDGKTYVVYDNMAPSEVGNYLTHEAWHNNAESIFSPKQLRSIAQAARNQAAAGDKDIQASIAKIPKNTPKEHLDSEIAARVLGDLQGNHPLGRRILDAAKLALNKYAGVPLNWMNAHEAALAKIGQLNLTHFRETPPIVARTRAAASMQAKAPGGRASATRTAARAAAPTVSALAREKPTRMPPERAPAVEGNEPASVGTKDEAKAEARALRGLEPVVRNSSMDEQAVWNHAAELRENDSRIGERLSDELAGVNTWKGLIGGGRRATPVEEAILAQHAVELHNLYDKAIDRARAARLAGDEAGLRTAQAERAYYARKLSINDKAARESGGQWGMAGRIRQIMSDRSYTIEAQERDFRAITGQDDLDDNLRDELKQRVGDIQRAHADLAETKANQQEAVEATKKAARGPRQSKKSPDEQFNTLAEQARALSGGKKGEPGGTQYARVEDPDLASIIRRMGRNRAAAGLSPEDNVNALHDALGGSIPHQDIRDTLTTNRPYRHREATEAQRRWTDTKRALRDPDAQRNATRMRQLNARLAELNRRMNEGDFAPPLPRTVREYSQDVQMKKLEVARTEKALESMKQKYERINDTPTGKVLRFINDARIAGILLSWPVYKKLLIGGAMMRNATQLAEEGITAGLGKTVLSKYAQESPRYHPEGYFGTLPRFAKGLAQWKDRAREDLAAGQNKWDMLYGNKSGSQEFTQFMGNMRDALGTHIDPVTGEEVYNTPGRVNRFLEATHAAARFVGSTHAAIKEGVSEPEMHVAEYKIGLWQRRVAMAEHPDWTPEQLEEHMGNELTTAAREQMAYGHALESKFQGRNIITDSFNTLLTRMENEGNVGGKLAAFGLKQEYPIRGIPLNIAKEFLTSYPFGWVKAAPAMLRFNKLSPEEKIEAANYIMKNAAKNTLGIAMAGTLISAAGGKFVNNFGGVQGAERHKGELKPDTMKIGDYVAGTETMHGPALEFLNLVASTYRIAKNEYGSDNGLIAAVKALTQAYPSAALRAIPYTDQPRRQIQTYQYAQRAGRPGVDALLGEQLRSTVEPALLQQYARGALPGLEHGPGVDPRGPEYYPKTHGLLEDLEVGLPYLRKNIP